MISAFGVEHIISKGPVVPIRPPCRGGANCEHLARIVRAYKPGDGAWKEHAMDALEAGHSDEEVGTALSGAVQLRHSERMKDIAEQARIKLRGVKLELKRRERGQ